MRTLIAVCIAMVMPTLGMAQDRSQTLADIRQELSVLYVEIQSLKRELSTTGSPSVTLPASVLDRVNEIERELQDLTGKTEQLQFRIDRIVKDGTNRIGDLEFRLVELEGGDLSQLGETTTLGGAVETPVIAPPIELPETPQPEVAVGELADFERAQKLLDDGDAAGAAEAFRTYTDTYPGGAYTADAHFFRGEAEAAQGAWSRAARAYLESFSGAPNGSRSPEALYKLGISLERLGQREEACLTLREVGVRFPGGSVAADAQTARSELSCP